MRNDRYVAERKILNTVETHNMLPRGSAVVVGVSGGKDSMALLHFLLEVKAELQLTIVVAHVNHGLRGKESDSDELFVRNFCQTCGIKVEVLNVRIDEQAKELKIGVEECGRLVRYVFFEELSNKYNAKIALAHTLSDSVETTIFNLARGAGPMGLCGIAAVRGKIIRPLIDLTTSEVLAYCRAAGLEHVEDSTNNNTKYARNKIRLDVVPALKKINPALEKTVARTAELLKADDKYLNELAREKLDELKVGENRYNGEKLCGLNVALRTRMVRLAVNALNDGARLGFFHVRLVMGMVEEGRGTVTLPGGICAKMDGGILEIYQNKSVKKDECDWEIPIFEPDNSLTERARGSIIKKVSKAEYDILLGQDESVEKIAVDGKAIVKNTLLRNRRAGDTFSLRKRSIRKTVKKLFNEEKIPPEDRYRIAMLANGNNVVWMDGFGACEDFKVDENTKNVLIIKTENLYM